MLIRHAADKNEFLSHRSFDALKVGRARQLRVMDGTADADAGIITRLRAWPGGGGRHVTKPTRPAGRVACPCSSAPCQPQRYAEGVFVIFFDEGHLLGKATRENQ